MSAPDAEALFVAALRAKVTLVISSRISTSLGGTFPAIRVTLTGGVGELVEGTWRASLQWESWGNSEAEAALVADEVAGLSRQLVGTYTTGKIVSSWPQGHHFHSPDAQTNRQRYIGQIGLLTQS